MELMMPLREAPLPGRGMPPPPPPWELLLRSWCCCVSPPIRLAVGFLIERGAWRLDGRPMMLLRSGSPVVVVVVVPVAVSPRALAGVWRTGAGVVVGPDEVRRGPAMELRAGD